MIPVVHIVYHRADFDGLLSGAICRQWHENPKGYDDPNVEAAMRCEVVMHGWDYGDPVPHIPKTDTLMIVDLSVEGLMDHPNLVWIDHHKSAIDKYPETIEGLRIDGVAACRLCWQWFYCKGRWPEKGAFGERVVTEPLVLTLAGEYDVWDLHDPRAEQLQYGLTALRFDASCPVPLDYETEDLVTRGRHIQEYVKAFNAATVRERSYRIRWEGLNWLVLNTARGNSQSFEGAYLEDVDALMMWRHDGGKMIVSLYHKPGRTDLDLSLLAVKYGGGGHRGACGFHVYSDDPISELEPTYEAQP